MARSSLPGVSRPLVDVIVPFAGSQAALEALRLRLAALELEPGDTILVADNRRQARPCAADAGRPRVIDAAGEGSPAFARNRGAEPGSNPWLVLLDSDVSAPPDLVAALFTPPPADRTALLAGAVRDEVPGDGRAPAAIRYAHLKGMMGQDSTLGHGAWGFPLTANLAVRREAFEAMGGFEEGIFTGEDADLWFRLRAAGWELERREAAAVVHRTRPTISSLLGQIAAHGAAIAWVDRRWPGSFPARLGPGLLAYGARTWVRAARAAARGDRDAALVGLLDPPALWAFELGRLGDNAPHYRQRR